MILVDTSIFIDLFRKRKNEGTEKFNYIEKMQITYGINNYIFTEILQGAKNENEFNELNKYFETQIFYSLKNQKYSYLNVAKMYFKCRKIGITIDSTIDFLIVQTAIENDLYLLHNDSDFIKIKKANKELKFY